MIIKPIKVENVGFDREVSYKEYAVNIRDKNTDKFINQYDCYETYDKALQSAKAIDLKDDEIYEIVEIEYDENGDELGINTITDSTLEECNSLKENYSLVGIYTDEHGMEKRDIIKSFDNKEDVDKYMEENEEELKAKNYDKMITESNKMGEVKSMNKLKENRQYTSVAKLETKQVLNRARRLKTESKTLDESLKDYGVKPSPEFLQSVIDKMVDNLGISKYEFKIEEDAIKFRYNGKVYFAEPVSMYQVDIFDDNHNKIGYGVGVNDIKEEVFTEYTDNDYLYELVGGKYAGTYTRAEAEKLPIKEPELTDDLSDIRASGGFVHRKELDNQLQFKGYLGPMWNGTQDGKAVIRYETQEVYDMLSR